MTTEQDRETAKAIVMATNGCDQSDCLLCTTCGEELENNIASALTTKEQQVWRDIPELSRQSVKKSMVAGLSVSAAEILLRRLELKIESAAKKAEGNK